MKNILSLFCKFFNIKDYKIGFFIFVSCIIMFVIGITSIFIRMPMSWETEASHYARAIEVTHGDFLTPENGNMAFIGGDISKSQSIFIDRTSNIKTEPFVFWTFQNLDLKYSSNTEFRTNTNTIPYFPFVYFPYIIVVYVVKLLSIGPVIEFLLMRLFGFIVFFAVFLLAIKKIPFGKVTLTIIGLLPALILSFASVSADNYTIAFAMLFTAVLLDVYYKILNNKQIIDKDVLYLMIVSLLLVMGKIPVFVLIFLILPIAYFGYKKSLLSKENAINLYITFIVGLIFSFVWLYIVKDVNTGPFWNVATDNKAQLLHILANFKSFIVMLCQSILYFDFLNLHLVLATSSHKFHYYFPTVINMLFFVSVLFSIGIQDDKKLKLITKDSSYYSFEVSKILTIIVYTVLVFVILYFQFNNVGATKINGIQARYFLPIWALLFIFYNRLNTYRYQLLIYILALIPIVQYIIFVLSQIC